MVDRCPVCTEVAAGLWSGCFAPSRHGEGAPAQPASSPGRAERSFDEVFDRVQGKVLRAQADFAGERAEARRLLSRLLGQPLERQLILAANSRRYQTWGMCELLLAEAWGSRFREPRRTEALCRVAVAASAALPIERDGRALTSDFQARCWIGLANGRRILDMTKVQSFQD